MRVAKATFHLRTEDAGVEALELFKTLEQGVVHLAIEFYDAGFKGRDEEPLVLHKVHDDVLSSHLKGKLNKVDVTYSC